MYYKNASHSTKTYWGVTFKPGEIKEVPGYINDIHFCKVDEPKNNNKVTKSIAKTNISTSSKSDNKDISNTESKPKTIETIKEETK